MGNWTTVKIEGTCDEKDVPALKRAVNTGRNWDEFHCLCNFGPSLCGLGDWVGTEIDVVGNLAERDYDKHDVQEQLQKLLKVAPSLSVRVHVGGNYEDKQCVATVICDDGKVTIEPPRIQTIPEISEDQILAGLMNALAR